MAVSESWVHQIRKCRKLIPTFSINLNLMWDHFSTGNRKRIAISDQKGTGHFYFFYKTDTTWIESLHSTNGMLLYDFSFCISFFRSINLTRIRVLRLKLMHRKLFQVRSYALKFPVLSKSVPLQSSEQNCLEKKTNCKGMHWRKKLGEKPDMLTK